MKCLKLFVNLAFFTNVVNFISFGLVVKAEG